MPDSTTTKPSDKWWVMASVAIGIFLSTIDGSIVNVALPTLARALKAPFAAVQWVVLAYLDALKWVARAIALMLCVALAIAVRSRRLRRTTPAPAADGGSQ